MLPINKKNGPCDPISSNCVIWQGPDIECVDICHGDSISAVVAGLCDMLLAIQNGSGSGSGAVDISQINQTALNGGPATTQTELIQLIIDNINSGSLAPAASSGAGAIWDCGKTLDCSIDIPACYKPDYKLTNPDSIYDVLQSLMEEMCSQETKQKSLTNSIQKAVSDVAQVKAAPKGDPNPTVASVYVDKDNTSQQPVAVLLNKVELAYGKTADNVGTESDVARALSATPTTPIKLSDPVTSRTGFTKMYANPLNLAQALDTAMQLIVDLRDAVEKLQIDSGTNGILVRMVGINSFYAVGVTCAAATTNAGTSSNCVDIWNSTGVEFDKTVKAYSSPVASSSYELLTGNWYVLCPGNGARAQYLGGATGVNTPPFWSDTVTTCGGG